TCALPILNCPYNATTGKGYSGGNAIWLMMRQEMEGYTDSRWLTYKQGQQLEAQVRRGEKGTKLVKWLETKSKNKSEGADEGEEEGSRKRLVPIVFTVFNAEQLDNMPPAPVRQLPGEFERHAQCERLLDDVRAMGVFIEHDGGNRAFYVPSEDAIHLPAREQFVAADGYYATALHECGHATGHPSRLGRDLT